MTPSVRRNALVLLSLGLVLILFVPEPGCHEPQRASGEPFRWGRDAPWKELERAFVRARSQSCHDQQRVLDAHFEEVDAALTEVSASRRSPQDPKFDHLEGALFQLGASVGACPDRVGALVDRVARTRRLIEDQSVRWDLAARPARVRVYRLLYGGRAVLEHVLLQGAAAPADPNDAGTAEPSRTPSVSLHGVELHSGDILVSRGGAPTSALIARGNDYPGNFSHVALVHVDPKGRARIIESHIERGVVVGPPDGYLRDKKLRIMVLRPRADVEPVASDPMLPHRAATGALERARARHIPYDFAMDHRDSSKQFCSEVASAAYAAEGVGLWEGLTSMSSKGVARWLASFGVEHFETHGPSDLEYDPKLRVVAEWRDPETLLDDQLDAAVIDAMLEGAERGEPVGLRWWRLPIARTAKLVSVVMNHMDAVGPVPEGMSATVALRVENLRHRHGAIKGRLRVEVERLRARNAYMPPYWKLVELARGAREAAQKQ